MYLGEWRARVPIMPTDVKNGASWHPPWARRRALRTVCREEVGEGRFNPPRRAQAQLGPSFAVNASSTRTCAVTSACSKPRQGGAIDALVPGRRRTPRAAPGVQRDRRDLEHATATSAIATRADQLFGGGGGEDGAGAVPLRGRPPWPKRCSGREKRRSASTEGSSAGSFGEVKTSAPAAWRPDSQRPTPGSPHRRRACVPSRPRKGRMAVFCSMMSAAPSRRGLSGKVGKTRRVDEAAAMPWSGAIRKGRRVPARLVATELLPIAAARANDEGGVDSPLRSAATGPTSKRSPDCCRVTGRTEGFLARTSRDGQRPGTL